MLTIELLCTRAKGAIAAAVAPLLLVLALVLTPAVLQPGSHKPVRGGQPEVNRTFTGRS